MSLFKTLLLDVNSGRTAALGPVGREIFICSTAPQYLWVLLAFHFNQTGNHSTFQDHPIYWGTVIWFFSEKCTTDRLSQSCTATSGASAFYPWWCIKHESRQFDLWIVLAVHLYSAQRANPWDKHKCSLRLEHIQLMLTCLYFSLCHLE